MKSNYSKVEGMLYGHYKRKNRLGSLISRLIRAENRIKRIRVDIKECNIEFGETVKGIDYSREPGNGNSVASSIERELEIAIDNMIRELKYAIKDKYKTIAKIRELEKRIDDVEILLEKLTEEELRIVELIYGERMKYREMEDLVNMGRSTIQRKKDTIVKLLIDS